MIPKTHDAMILDKNSLNKLLAKNVHDAVLSKYGFVNQTQLSKITGVSQASLGNILRASGHSPSILIVAKIAYALEIPVWHLIHPDLKSL